MPVAENKYTVSEVAERNGKDGAEVWFYIKDVVYDVTKFMNQHPGGPELLMEYAGKNATNAFYDFGHSADATKLLKSFKIGDLIKEEKRNSKSNKSVKSDELINGEITGDAKKKSIRKIFMFC